MRSLTETKPLKEEQKDQREKSQSEAQTSKKPNKLMDYLNLRVDPGKKKLASIPEKPQEKVLQEV